MKILNIIFLFVLTQTAFASFEEEQTRELKDSHVPTLYYATPELDQGKFKLLRNADSPDKVKIIIIKQTGETSTVSSSPTLARTRDGGLAIQGPRKLATFAVKKRFEIELDFTKAAKLGAEDIENIELLLNFAEDDIEVTDVSINTDDSDRNYRVKEDLTGFFGFNKDDAKIQFVTEE